MKKATVVAGLEVIVFLFESTLVSYILSTLSILFQQHWAVSTSPLSLSSLHQRCIYDLDPFVCMIQQEIDRIAIAFLFAVIVVLIGISWIYWRSPSFSFPFSTPSIVPFFTKITLSIMFYLLTRWWIGEDYLYINRILHKEGYIDYGVFFSYVLISPVLEEWMYRRWLFYIVHNRFPTLSTSLYCSAFLFSAMHIPNILLDEFGWFYSGLQFPYAFLVGLFYGTRYVISGSIFQPTLLHIINNLLAVLVSPHVLQTVPYLFLFTMHLLAIGWLVKLDLQLIYKKTNSQ